MDGLTLGLSILALLVSVGAVWYSRRQANAQQRATQIAENLAHANQRPDIRLTFRKWTSPTNLAELLIENRDGSPIHQVTVALAGGKLPNAGFGDGQPRASTHTVTQLEPALPVSVDLHTVDANAWANRTVVFLVTPSRKDRGWEPQLIEAVLPPVVLNPVPLDRGRLNKRS